MLGKLWQQIRSSLSSLNGASFMAMAILTVSAIVLGLRHGGKLEYWELQAYDRLVLWREDIGPDSRLLLVTIDEEDLREQMQWPLSDRVYAQLLRRLQSLQPKVIGLDIYRDLPVEPGHEEFVQQLLQPNVFGIRSIDTLGGTPAPPSLQPEQVGFNDLLPDIDGVIRRNLLFAGSKDGILYSFSLRLALTYLKDQEIFPTSSQENPNYLQLGAATFFPLEPDSGGYQTMDSEGYQILLNYRNRRKIAQSVSISQVLAGEIEADLVRDKIVLIGSTASSLKDDFFTPYSRDESESQKMPGVMLHAQMVSQLLDAALSKRPLFWFIEERGEILWIVFWVSLGGIMGLALRHPIVLSLGVGGSLASLLAIVNWIFANSGWVPVATPILGFFLAVGMVVSYQSYQNLRQQQTVMKLLGQNTSPEIADALWQERDRLLFSGKLPGVSLTATLMFLDLKGFSIISETMSPEDLLNWLNELLADIGHEIVVHKGIINKFTGDGLMAVFGAPIPRKTTEEIGDDAGNCVNCALAISDYLERINFNWQQQGLPLMQVRIGIFTGPVVVGSLGGKDRIEYGVIGDTVNTAARLEGCEKHRQPNNCRILIGKETLVYLQDEFEVESWGPIALKGKQQMVDVYLVTGKRD
ncbi:MAG: adenylate/guanylate cyclase domain-containing protein [Prochloron sp. SP5CPC1]|nr:adenylate/guanylate cyclase domain-containing protein [Candidatus Paraprochloron terpiosi SP5CPC1]